MPLLMKKNEVGFVRLWMKSGEFSKLLKTAMKQDPKTLVVERQAKDLISADFKEPDTVSFVKAVCGWGNYAGVGGNVLKKNAVPDIVSALREGYRLSVDGKYSEAISRVTRLDGLAVSFGSKHLRFLAPDRCVVLDSVLSQRLGYPMDPESYAEFRDDCDSICKKLNADQVPYPIPDGGEWRVADVEHAIYAGIIEKLRS